MLIYKNFNISKTQSILEKYPDFVLVLEDEAGNDWYELQKNFDDATLKILFDKANRIVSQSFDVSTLMPANLSIAEISQEKIPDDFFTNITGYVFIDEKIEPLVLSQEEVVAITESKKQTLLYEANNAIAPLQDAVDLNIATKKEMTSLKAWREYRIFLNRIDASNTLSIIWPQKP